MDGREISWGIDHGYEVHAFEPNPNCKKFLEQYETLATINYAAAWDTDGEVVLHLMGTSEGGEDGVSLIKEKTNVSQERVIVTPAINIGKYLRKLDKDIDILKVNAEGAEYVILESILDEFDYTRINRWLVEDHANYIRSEDWRQKKEEVLARLRNLAINIEDYHGL